MTGRIVIAGEEQLRLKERQRRQSRGQLVGMIFQDPNAALDPVRRVGGQVAEALWATGMSRKDAHARSLELLAEVGLYNPGELARRFPFELSGGMKQRVVIAAAMGPRPKVLVADEPTTALDTTIQDQVLHLLDQLKRSHGTGVLLITHDLAVAARTASTVSIMYGGKIVESGLTSEVLTAPRHPYTVGLINAIPRLRGGMELPVGIAGETADNSVEWSGCSFAPRCERVLERCADEVPTLVSTASGTEGLGARGCLLELDADVRASSARFRDPGCYHDADTRRSRGVSVTELATSDAGGTDRGGSDQAVPLLAVSDLTVAFKSSRGGGVEAPDGFCVRWTG